MRLFAVLLLLTIAPALAAKTDDRRNDEHSYAEPTKVVVKDIALDLTVDFEKKIIAGNANLSLEWAASKQKHILTNYQLVLDTRDLAITKIEGTTGRMAWQPLKYELAARDDIFGSKLTINMPQRYGNVRITYSTSPNASGLQWLDAPLTAGKMPDSVPAVWPGVDSTVMAVPSTVRVCGVSTALSINVVVIEPAKGLRALAGVKAAASSVPV